MFEKGARVIVLLTVSCSRNPPPQPTARDAGAQGAPQPRAAAPTPNAAPAARPDAGPVLPEGRGTVTFRAAGGASVSIPVDIARTHASVSYAEASGRGPQEGRGLLLQYGNTEPHVFSMERVGVESDVVYVSANSRQILAAVKRAAPRVVTPPVTREASASVLLLPGGFLDANNLTVGDALEITSDQPAAAAPPLRRRLRPLPPRPPPPRPPPAPAAAAPAVPALAPAPAAPAPAAH